MNAPTYLVIKNGTLITPEREISDGVIIVLESKILDLGNRRTIEEPVNAEIIDAKGAYIAPGLIDIHVNGAMGSDVTKAQENTFSTMGDFLAKKGTTSYLGTAITSADNDFLNTLKHAQKYMADKNTQGAELLGIHMEGPYLSPAQSGAHPHKFISMPEPAHYRQFLDYGNVLKMMTLAPEVQGAAQLVSDLKKQGIIAAAGHTDGIYSEMISAIDEGIAHATHFFCNMSHFRRDKLKRVAGAAETLLYDDRISAEIIADGWHVGPLLMNLLLKVKGVDRVCFVTDAMPAVGLPDGKHQIGDVEAVVEDGIARLPDNSAYAGSVATMDLCVKNGMHQMGLSRMDSVRMASLTPAEIMGVSDTKGSLQKGKDADIVIFDHAINIQKTIVKGKLTYSS